MPRLLRALIYAIGSGVVLGALAFGGGFLLALMLGQEAQQALGMLVPMVIVPAAILIGACLGAYKGYNQT